MLKKLVARSRVLKLGATLVGASALAIGFASPAFAFSPTVPTGGNANSANTLIVMGGSNTTYLMMQQLSDVFNQAPGCDLAAAGTSTQPLDYGCPGLNGEAGNTLSHDVVTNITGDTTSGSTSVTNVSSLTGILAGESISGTGIPAGDTIKKTKGTNKIILAAAATQTLTGDNLSVITTPGIGEDGFLPFGNENPFNDVLVQEPALGSSNGIAELEELQAHAPASPNVSAISAARSSRAPNLAGGSKVDFDGLNFVAYAMDGVTWIHWTKVKSVATPSATVTNLTTAQLLSIYTDSLTCPGPGGTTLTNNWYCLNGGKGTPSQEPIALYIAQNGSGTEATWVTALNIPSSDTFPFGGENARHVIFENETQSILANNDEANAIFFFSFGKYESICAPNPTFCSGGTTNTVALGQMNGITVDKATIANQLPGATGTPFPGDRLIYNVYSDGSDSANISTADAATMNAVSEDGFICKPSTATDVDPNTGSTYLTEIQKIITSQGFFPLPLEVENGQGDTTNPLYNTTASGIPNPAWNDGLGTSAYNLVNEGPSSVWNFPAPDQDTDRSAVAGTYTGVYDDGTTGSASASIANPVGYCLVLTTDANGKP
jgi:hypothetical protein